MRISDWSSDVCSSDLTGRAIHNAIVWQDRRTADLCARLKREGNEAGVSATTGLILDPYFSGTKIAWILDSVDGARSRAEAGKLAFGTVDSWLLWKLTGGRVNATDARSEEHTSELQSLMRITYAVFC